MENNISWFEKQVMAKKLTKVIIDIKLVMIDLPHMSKESAHLATAQWNIERAIQSLEDKY